VLSQRLRTCVLALAVLELLPRLSLRLRARGLSLLRPLLGPLPMLLASSASPRCAS